MAYQRLALDKSLKRKQSSKTTKLPSSQDTATDRNTLDKQPDMDLLRFEAMFGPCRNAENKDIQADTGSTCQHCEELLPDFHFYVSADPDKRFIDCMYCRASTDTIKLCEEHDIDLVAIGQDLRRGVLPENVDDLRSLMLDMLDGWLDDWQKDFERNTTLRIPPSLKASCKSS